VHELLIASLVLLVTLAGPALAGADSACPPAGALHPDDVLLGYVGNVRRTGDGRTTTRVGSFRALGILRSGKLVASDGAAIHDGMKFWRVLDPSAPPTALNQVSSFLDRLGEDHCVYHGEPDQELASWTVLSSRSLAGVFHHPEESDQAYFAEHHDACVDQGDYEPSQKPPCSRPHLLAVSDIDGDGAKEFWSTEPYRWDTGITVWQRSEDGLARMFDVCSGCSD
jgi:hypothetical protein